MNRKERKMRIKVLHRQLRSIDSERKFVWKTPKYQEAHKSLLDKQEEKITRELERIL